MNVCPSIRVSLTFATRTWYEKWEIGLPFIEARSVCIIVVDFFFRFLSPQRSCVCVWVWGCVCFGQSLTFSDGINILFDKFQWQANTRVCWAALIDSIRRRRKKFKDHWVQIMFPTIYLLCIRPSGKSSTVTSMPSPWWRLSLAAPRYRIAFRRCRGHSFFFG